MFFIVKTKNEYLAFVQLFWENEFLEIGSKNDKRRFLNAQVTFLFYLIL